MSLHTKKRNRDVDVEKKVFDANRRLHGLIATEYDDRKAINHESVVDNLKRFIHPCLKARSGLLLDFGCGTGYVSRLVADYDFKVIGFDATPEMLIEARKRDPDFPVVAADAFAVPFAPATFDVVAVSGVLHHLVDYPLALTGALELIKPGGLILILNEPNAAGYRLFKPLRFLTSRALPERRVKKHVARRAISATDESLAEYHLHFSDGVEPRALISLMVARGFRTLRLQYTNLNMISNLGDRVSFDFLARFPALRHLNTGGFSLDFNLIAEKT